MYSSLTESNTYFDTYDLSGLWSTYTDAQKTSALNKATLQIDRLQYHGERYALDQDNEFPRIFYFQGALFYWDMDTDSGILVPQKIKHATCEQAKYLLDNLNNNKLDAQKKGVTSLSVGSTSESYDLSKVNFDKKTGLCLASYMLVKQYFIRFN